MKTKRDTVLETATMLFAEQGFENTSVANICEAAKVSKGLVYHHFKSKEEILIEIFTQTTQYMVEMNQSKSSEPPATQLINLIRSIFSQLEQEKLFFQFNLGLMFQPHTKTILKDHIKERSAVLLESVRDIFDQIDSPKSTLLSFIFIAEIDGIALDYLSVFDDYPLQDMKEYLIGKYKEMGQKNLLG